MAIEHFSEYQLELIPLELAGLGRWAAYLAIHKFDRDKQDFVCVLEKHRVSATEFSSEADAIKAAREAANAWIESNGGNSGNSAL